MDVEFAAYAGKDERTLRALLDTTKEFSERRKIRAALRDLIDNSTSSYKKRETPRSEDINLDMEAIKRHGSIMEAFPNTAEKRSSLQFRKRHGMILTKENIHNRLESIRKSQPNPYEEITDMEELTKKLKEAAELEDRVQIRTAIRKLKETQNGDEKEEPVRRSADPVDESQVTSNGTSEHCDVNGVSGESVTRDYSEITDIHQLEDMLSDTTEYSERKKIRTAIHDLRKERLATISRRLSRTEDGDRQQSKLVVNLKESTAPSGENSHTPSGQTTQMEENNNVPATRTEAALTKKNVRNSEDEKEDRGYYHKIVERDSSDATEEGEGQDGGGEDVNGVSPPAELDSPEDHGKGSTEVSPGEMDSKDHGSSSSDVSSTEMINVEDAGNGSTDVLPVEVNSEDEGKGSGDVTPSELTSKDDGTDNHSAAPPLEVTSKPADGMDDLNGRLADLENELDECKEFDRRREIRAQIRDIRSQIRENTIKMSSRHTKGDVGQPPLSRMSCLTDSSRPPKDVSLTRSFSTKEQGRNFLARKIQSQIFRSNSTLEKGSRNSAPPGTLESKEVKNTAAVESPYKVDGSRNQFSDYCAFNAITTKRIKRGDVRPTDDFNGRQSSVRVTQPEREPPPPPPRHQDGLSKDKSSSSDEMLDSVDAKVIVASLTEHQHKSGRQSGEGRKEPRRLLGMGDRTLNMSKASSGYGSVSGSEEEEKEEEEKEEHAVVPEILQALSDMTFTDDEPVTLTCKISGGPKVKVTWYKDSTLLKPSENMQQSFDGTEAKLTMTDVCEEDSGEYKCVATTGAGTKETAAIVTITENLTLVAPSVEKPLSDIIVKDGADVTFECDVSGKPAPKLTWFKASQLLKDSPDFRQTYRDGVARMAMEDVFPDDNGTYVCVAVNEAGECQTTCTLTVQEEVREGVEAPDIVTPLENVEAVDGGTVTFKCEISGVPKPMLTWYKDDKLLPNCSDFEQTYDGKTAVLVIDEVFEDDTGEYKVLAKNSAGDASIAALLNVRGNAQKQPELLVHGRPQFTSPLAPQMTVIDGESACLECRLTTNPRQTAVWYKDAKILRPGIGYKQTFDGTLARFEIREVFPDDAGNYECAVRNAFGEERCSCEVTVKEQRRERNFDETFKSLSSGKTKAPGGSTGLSRVQSMNVRLQDEKNRLRPPGGATGLSRVQSLKAKLDNNINKWTKHESVTSSQFGTKAAKMPATERDIDNIDDEDVLHKMMTDTTDFNLRKKIRGRMRDVREAKSGTDVAMKLDHAKAAQLKAKHFGKGGADEDSSVTTTKTERGSDGSTTTTNVTSVRKTTKDGSSITTTQTKQVTQTGGLGKTSYTVKKTSAASSSSSGPNWGRVRAHFGLLEAGGVGGRVAVQRSPSAIKDMLLTWCKQMTKEYDNVEIKNFSSSWNDGMAFAALIHHFRPVFDYKRLNPKCRRGNFKLAFDVAEKFADIAPLLDVEDMVKMKNPDWKCVFTYVQSYYRRFRDDPMAQPGGVAKAAE